MSSGLNHKRFSNCNAVDMSSSAITSRLREVSQLHQLGLSLANAKPMVTYPQSVDKTDANPPSTNTFAPAALSKSSSVTKELRMEN